jgi:hypothetical protein
MKRVLLVLATLVLALAGCSMAADTAAAEQGVPKFHEMLDAARFDDIWTQCADDMKNASTQADFVALLEAVHRKLGRTKSSSKVSWAENASTSGTFVTLVYKTSYDGGDAQEQFVFRIRDKTALLAGYHVSSNALILK